MKTQRTDATDALSEHPVAADEVEPSLRPKPVALRAGEWGGLDDLARRLQDSRSVRGGQRLTANTVIRVAIDGIMAYRGQLRGDTEKELRAAWLGFLSGPARKQRQGPDDEPLRGKKHVTIRSDQWTDLDAWARRLQDARACKEERITSNTIIRVAIHGVLAHSDRLQGDTEEELRTVWMEFLASRAAR